MSGQLLSIFKQANAPEARGKYLSRVFGVFSEEIVRIWANDLRTPYQDIGRPTLRLHGEAKGHTLDFTFKDKLSGKLYVVELKCEIEYQNFKYLILKEVAQLDHHKKGAFIALLDAAAKKSEKQIFVNKKLVEINGAILIWGDATPEGRNAIIEEKGFFDIITIARIIGDLKSWGSEPYQMLLEQRRKWSNEMFDALSSDLTQE